MTNRIGVVEFDEIERIGRLAALGTAGCSVIDAVSPMEADGWSEEMWQRFDVVCFGIHPDHSSWDRFWCVDTARRAHLANPNLRLVGLYEKGVRPLVRKRLLGAGMHRLWPARRTRTVEELARLMMPQACEADRLQVSGYDIRGATVGPRTDPRAVLALVEGEDLREVFDHPETQATTGLSRRQIIRLRRRISELGDLSVPSGYATGGPDVDRSLPSWRSVVDYVNRARGYDEDAAVAALIDEGSPRIAALLGA